MTARQMEDAVVNRLGEVIDRRVTIGRLNRPIQVASTSGDDQVLLVYRGSRFGVPSPGQRRRVAFEVYVGSQSLRKEKGHHGALDLVEEVRSGLSGFRIDGIGESDAKLWCESEDLTYYDEKRAVYWYLMRWITETTYV